jgi:hypothetical protein
LCQRSPECQRPRQTTNLYRDWEVKGTTAVVVVGRIDATTLLGLMLDVHKEKVVLLGILLSNVKGVRVLLGELHWEVLRFPDCEF